MKPKFNMSVAIVMFLLLGGVVLLYFYPISGSSSGKILRQSFQNWEWDSEGAEKWASTIDVYQAQWYALDIVPEIKAIRPDVLALVYFNSIIVREEPASINYFFPTFRDNNWILKDAYGNYIRTSSNGYYIDIGNADYHTWLANWYRSYIDEYELDGASIDNWFVNSIVWYATDQTAINPRTGNPWTDQQICDAGKAMTNKIREVIGPNKIILGNGVHNGDRFYWDKSHHEDGLKNGGLDAVMSEGWVSSYNASEWYSESSWKNSIDFAIWLEGNWSQGKYFMPICMDESFAGGGNFPGYMTEQQYQQYVTYCYASRLLTVKRLTTIMAFGYYIENPYPQSLLKIKIGKPSESYHTLETSHVYARTFSGGMVLVNPTYNSYTVTIGSGYKNAVTGSSVSSTLTVQPHTGLILTKA